MLIGVPSMLTGKLLVHLDAMGHGDTLVVADAHFPAAALGRRLVELPGLSAPQVIRAIRTVLPLDTDRFAASGVDLMRTGDGKRVPVQSEIIAAANLGPAEVAPRDVERFAFYENATAAYLIVRTGEVRSYGNAILHKGLVTPDESWRA